MSFRELVDSIAVPEGVEVASRRSAPGWNAGAAASKANCASRTRMPCSKNSAASSARRRPGRCGRRLSSAGRAAIPVRGRRNAGGGDELFQKYVAWLKDAKLFDLNIVSHGWRAKTEALYDFVVVDEVQDFTSAQLALIFDSLKTKDRFLLAATRIRSCIRTFSLGPRCAPCSGRPRGTRPSRRPRPATSRCCRRISATRAR